MREYAFLFLSVILFNVFGHPVLAQRGSSNPAEGLAALVGCGGCFVIPVIILVLNIALLVWIARDAKSRGMDSAVIWMLLVMFTSVVGLIIYLLSRPQGNLIQCSHCSNRRLQASARCPYCGNV